MQKPWWLAPAIGLAVAVGCDPGSDRSSLDPSTGGDSSVGHAGASGMLGGSGAAGMSGASGAAGAGCIVPIGAWTGEGRHVVFEAECAWGPDVGECDGCTEGSQSGTRLPTDGAIVTRFGDGDYLMYAGLDLTDLNTITARYATPNGGLVEVRVDAVDGPLVGTWDPMPTGSRTSWYDGKIAIEPTEGVHDLYFVGASGDWIAELDFFVVGMCTPDCEDKNCGADGCGGICGTCAEAGDFCDDTQNCTPCVPDCEGKECGDDTCGGACGEGCAEGEVCGASRQCVAYDSLGGPPRLRVNGNALEDPDGNPVVVRGVSLIDIGAQHLWRAGVIDAIDRLTGDGWHTEIVRLAVYPTDNPLAFPVDHHLEREQYMANVLRPAVDHATQKGLYVIVDWHEIGSITDRREEETRAFWQYMGGQFADYPNVIYELYNEPIDQMDGCVAGDNDDCWPPFKAHADGWIEIVRQSAPDTLLLVGGPSWSQVIGPAADDPVSDSNVAYVGHIYPMHIGNTQVEDQIARCAAVHPVILTEWGYGFDASDRTADRDPYVDRLRSLVEQNNLSWTAWVADHEWGPPMYADPDGTLNDFGTFVQNWLAE